MPNSTRVFSLGLAICTCAVACGESSAVAPEDASLPDAKPESGDPMTCRPCTMDAALPPDTLAAFDSPAPDRNDQAEAGDGETPVLDTNVDSSCVRPLSELGWSCPATFADVLANNITCITYEEIDIGECATDHLSVLRRNFGTHAVDCLYDPQSQALVGAVTTNDVPTCGNSRVATTSETPLCQAPCGGRCDGDGSGSRFSRLERTMECCQKWPYPVPGCPRDGGAGQ